MTEGLIKMAKERAQQLSACIELAKKCSPEDKLKRIKMDASVSLENGYSCGASCLRRSPSRTPQLWWLLSKTALP